MRNCTWRGLKDREGKIRDEKLEREKEEMEAVVDMSRERMKGWEGSSVERRCGDSRWRKRSEEISLERPGRI